MGAGEKTKKEPSQKGALASRIEEAGDKARRAKKSRDEDRALEAKLVEKAKTGDSHAFRILVERNQKRLFAVAFGIVKDRDDAMDAVQDTFIKAHRKLADFQAQAAFSTWLYRICVNVCIDRKRAQKRRRQVHIDDAPELSTETDAPYSGVDIAPNLSGSNPLRNANNRELGQKISEAMAELSEDHRQVLLLREVEGMSYEEIAETLEIPKGTVMSRLFHARKNMQVALRPYLEADNADG
jgi:RNA polymerase sigma-70 factor (ECF subfamily)